MHDIDIELIGLAAFYIVQPELVVFFKYHAAAVGIDQWRFDGRSKLGKCCFLPVLKCIEIVFAIGFIGNKIDIARFVDRRKKIFPDPISIAFVFFCSGIVRLYIGIERPLVTLACRLVIAFPGIVEKDFTCLRGCSARLWSYWKK